MHLLHDTEVTHPIHCADQLSPQMDCTGPSSRRTCGRAPRRAECPSVCGLCGVGLRSWAEVFRLRVCLRCFLARREPRHSHPHCIANLRASSAGSSSRGVVRACRGRCVQRRFNHRSPLHAKRPKLLSWCKRGGACMFDLFNVEC